MQVRERFTLTLAAVAVLAACAGRLRGREADRGRRRPPRPARRGDADGRPAALRHLPLVELVGPAATNAGPAPVFEWRTVDGALAYRLSVRGPETRTWAWSGPETSVRYGGVAEGQSGPTIVPGSRWSVAAFSGDGSLLALSELRPVSPTDDPGPAPDWLDCPGPAASPARGRPRPPASSTPATCSTADEISGGHRRHVGNARADRLRQRQWPLRMDVDERFGPRDRRHAGRHLRPRRLGRGRDRRRPRRAVVHRQPRLGSSDRLRPRRSQRDARHRLDEGRPRGVRDHRARA